MTGPRTQGEKVEYTVRLFPLGGYVGFPDEQSKFEKDDPNLLQARKTLNPESKTFHISGPHLVIMLLWPDVIKLAKLTCCHDASA